ncbi:MAG: alpha/beta hydrolase [Candidatus Omnitrophica bacterium]|nr:alpha/beta hydrolase [Candidatus Omnitrophota bacterium]
MPGKLIYFLLKCGFLKRAENLSVDQERKFFDDLGKSQPLPSGIKVEKLTIAGLPAESLDVVGSGNKTILYLHGGAYNFGSCESHRPLAAWIAKILQMRLILLEYRRAPESPFPAAVEDTVSAYQWLLDNKNSPQNIIFIGDSAGGGLAVAAALALRDKKLPLPDALVCLSPWVDLKHTGESITGKAREDVLLTLETLQKTAARYAGPHPYENPLISPVYADLSGLPRMLIQVGDKEILLSDSTRLAEQAQQAGGEVKLEIWPGMWHVWHYLSRFLPEGKQAIRSIKDWLNN